MRSRGDIEVSVKWEKSVVELAVIHFHSRHPWLQGIVEYKPQSGIFSPSSTTSEVEVTVATGNELSMIKSSCAQVKATDNKNAVNYWTKGLVMARLVISSFPCEVYLCNAKRSRNECQELLREYLL